MRSLLGVDENVVDNACRNRVQLEPLEGGHRQLDKELEQLLLVRKRVQVLLQPGKKTMGIRLLRLTQVIDKPIDARNKVRFYTFYRFHVLITRRRARGFTLPGNAR